MEEKDWGVVGGDETKYMGPRRMTRNSETAIFVLFGSTDKPQTNREPCRSGRGPSDNIEMIQGGREHKANFLSRSVETHEYFKG